MTTCSVSLSPVMKMIGTSASAGLRLSWRQVSKPSMFGISASSSTMSGVILRLILSAWAPSRATSTVMPAFSSTSLSMRMLSSASSTISTVSLIRLRVFMVVYLKALAYGVELEGVSQADQLAVEGGMFGILLTQLVQRLEQSLAVTNVGQPTQLLPGDRRRGSGGDELRLGRSACMMPVQF